MPVESQLQTQTFRSRFATYSAREPAAAVLTGGGTYAGLRTRGHNSSTYFAGIFKTESHQC
jgi:hypothetical protein